MSDIFPDEQGNGAEDINVFVHTIEDEWIEGTKENIRLTGGLIPIIQALEDEEERLDGSGVEDHEQRLLEGDGLYTDGRGNVVTNLNFFGSRSYDESV